MYLIGTILLFVLSNDRKQKLISSETRNASVAIPFYTGMLQNTLPKASETILFESYLEQAKEKIANEKE
jgi:ATP/ADP translocase